MTLLEDPSEKKLKRKVATGFIVFMLGSFVIAGAIQLERYQHRRYTIGVIKGVESGGESGPYFTIEFSVNSQVFSTSLMVPEQYYNTPENQIGDTVCIMFSYRNPENCEALYDQKISRDSLKTLPPQGWEKLP